MPPVPTQYVVNLTQTIRLNNLTQHNYSICIQFDLNLFYYLLNSYVNMDDVYFEINHRNGLIYVLIDINKN